MKDEQIVCLYWQRQEQAVEETVTKYGSYCTQIAKRLLGNCCDVEECFNDCLQALWDSIPPNRPENLKTYIGKLTRRICMKRWRSQDAQKRGGGELPLSLDELSGCIPSGMDLDETMAAKDLTGSLNHFLAALPKQQRQVFVLRYWHGYSIREIGGKFGFSKSKVESMLHRTREKLRDQLRKEGYFE